MPGEEKVQKFSMGRVFVGPITKHHGGKGGAASKLSAGPEKEKREVSHCSSEKPTGGSVGLR